RQRVSGLKHESSGIGRPGQNNVCSGMKECQLRRRSAGGNERPVNVAAGKIKTICQITQCSHDQVLGAVEERSAKHGLVGALGSEWRKLRTQRLTRPVEESQG